MKHLDEIHPDNFYSKLVEGGQLIYEYVTGTDDDDEIVEYWGFEDAQEESEYEGTELSDHGLAIYFYEGKIYEAVVYVSENEATGINEYEDEDIQILIKQLKSFEDYDPDNYPWINNML